VIKNTNFNELKYHNWLNFDGHRTKEDHFDTSNDFVFATPLL